MTEGPGPRPGPSTLGESSTGFRRSSSVASPGSSPTSPRLGLLATEHARPDSIDENARTVRETAGLTAAVSASISDEDRRRELRDEVALLAAHTDEMLGRWAAVMLNAEVYAEVIDRHVELASDIAWLLSMLDNADPPDDHRRYRRATSSPAAQIEGAIEGDELARRIVVIAQLAEELDRNTLDLALRVVPVEWWATRLGAAVPPERGTVVVPPA